MFFFLVNTNPEIFVSFFKMFVQFSYVYTLHRVRKEFFPRIFSKTASKSRLSGRSKINIFQISDCRVFSQIFLNKMIGLLELLFMYWQLFIFSLALGKIHVKQILKIRNFKNKRIFEKK